MAWTKWQLPETGEVVKAKACTTTQYARVKSGLFGLKKQLQQVTIACYRVRFRDGRQLTVPRAQFESRFQRVSQ